MSNFTHFICQWMFLALSQVMTDSTILMFPFFKGRVCVVVTSGHRSRNCLLRDSRSDGSTMTLALQEASPLPAQAPPLGAVWGAKTERLGAGRGSRTLPPSAGRHLPARAFPRVPALGPRLAWEPPFSPQSPGRCASLSAGADSVPAGGAGGGAGAAAAVRRRGAPAAPERAPPPAPPARELGRGGRGQEAASAPGSAAAGVGATGAAEPAPRAAAAGVSGRDKGDGECSYGSGRAPGPPPPLRGPLGWSPKP